MLRAESSQIAIPEANAPPPVIGGPPKYRAAYEGIKKWIDETLDIYKPELRRILWPLFVHSYLQLVAELYPSERRSFFEHHKQDFIPEHEVDIRGLERISLPEHLNDDNVGKLYRDNKYRIVLSNFAFVHLMQYLEASADNGGKLLVDLLEKRCNIRHVDRAADDRFSFVSLLRRGKELQDVPVEDEGIPGHNPGNSIITDDPTQGNNLVKLRLGRLPLDKELEGDVRGDLEDMDTSQPALPGQDSLVEILEMNIKQEPDDEFPSRTELAYPPSSARDVAMEVQKIRENRDRFKIEGRTGGIGPGVSVCMFTFHNTFDSVTCLDFSGDNELVAAGTSESYIRIWSLDGKAIQTDSNDTPSASHRLIGHSGPVYAVSFAPSSSAPSSNDTKPTTKWLLSSSADSTIRLWNLDIFQQVVVYKGHIGPVWDLKWGPFGHYFVSGGHDKTARIWSTDKIRHLRLLAGHDDGVDVVAFHPNSAYVFTASSDKTVRMWGLTNGNAVRMFTGHTTGITALACSPSGKILASADENGWICLWDLAHGRLVKNMRGHGKGGIWSLSFSVESTVLVSGGADCTVRVWDVHGPVKDPGKGVAGDGGKVDGSAAGGVGGSSTTGVASGAVAGTVAGGAGVGGVPKKKGKEQGVSADQISAFPTKKSPVYKVKFTNMNLVVAGGAYLP
jgi:transcription initiation factor TFIID subunit 5